MSLVVECKRRGEDMLTILMTPQAWASPEAPPAFRDFWTLAYQAIDD